MSVDAIIQLRGITEVLHFTTHRGITGAFASGQVLSRRQLPKEKHLEHVCMIVCQDRSRDSAWHDYVNLSITSVNRNLFSIAKNRWYGGMSGWWCVISFRPEILTHADVWFTTTNNIYTGVCRSQGAVGLTAMFTSSIFRYAGNSVSRTAQTPLNQPTCNQAEVLYPKSVSMDYAQAIYFKNDESADACHATMSVSQRSYGIPFVVKPEMFV